MAQHDYVIANGTGAAVRSDLNNGLSAIVTQNSGATEPATTYAFMRWADTTAGVMKMRNSANNAWITLYQLDGEWTNIAFENGTAAAPSIYFKDSGTDTGFYSPGANQVGISTGGTARLTIDSNGNVDIDSNTLYVDATNNRVGLGTSSPSTTLSVAGGISGTAGMNISGAGWGVLPYVANSLVIDNNAGEARFFATGANATTRGSFIFYNGETDGGAGAAMVIDTSSRVGIGTTTVNRPLVVYNDSVAALALQNSTTGTAGSDGFQIQLVSSDGYVFNYENAPIIFGTNSTERARIDSSGRLLVGTSSFSGGARAVFRGNTAASGTQGVIILQRDGANPTTAQGLGEIRFQDSNEGWGASISAEGDATWSSPSDCPTKLVFSTTADGASSPTERMRISQNGDVLFNTTTTNTFFSGGRFFSAGDAQFTRSSNTALTLRRMTSDGAIATFIPDNGNVVGTISVTSTATAYNTSSDYRLKENIVLLTGATDRVNQLQVHRFNFIADPDKTVDGFIAHEAQAVVPECVTGTKDEVDADGNPVYQGIDQSKLVPLLTAALQEALAEIESLKARVTALEP